ncbi:MAG TPA: thiol reductant ABC exporter subunit CydD, partial [Solirubrobacterales bacterium]|nr:thiol reductant ABC exporter subunit CydD [Solirubrobacterales bacterium]
MSSSRLDPAARSRARATQRRLGRASRAARAQLGATVALGLVATALIVAQATLLAHVVVDAFLGGASLADLVPQLAALLGVSLVRGAVDFGFEASGRAGAARVMADLRARLVRHLLLVRPGALSEERSGELAAASVHGVDALEAYYARYLPQAVLAALAPIAILAWTLPRDWEAAAILAVTAPLIPVFMVLIGRLAEAATRRRWQRLARLSSRFLDLVGGLETLRANGRAAAQAESIAAAGESYRRETMATLRIGFLSALVLELLAMIGVALVAATVGIQLAEGSLGLTAGLTVLILAPEVYMPLRRLGSEFHAASDAMAAAEAIFAVLDRPGVVGVPGAAGAAAAPGTERRPAADSVMATGSRRAPDPSTEPLVLRGVSFAHPGRERVLDHVDLELEPGETVALVGPSGGGKSTLLSLLLRLADPEAGTIACGGVDLREVDPAAWRRRLAWVPQRPTIFAGTVAENIALGRPDASRAEIERAAQEAMLAPVLELLPDGLETRVGEDARRLSAGQAQRVGLARAFLLDAPLVLLDEPTAHLDAATEREVVAAIDRLCAGRTALIVAHREAAVRSATRVLELRHAHLTPAPMLTGRKALYTSAFRP